MQMIVIPPEDSGATQIPLRSHIDQKIKRNYTKNIQLNYIIMQPIYDPRPEYLFHDHFIADGNRPSPSTYNEAGDH